MDHIESVLPPMNAGIIHRSAVQIVLRDGITGEVKAVRTSRNTKVYGTLNWIYTAIVNSSTTGSAVYCGLGTGISVQSADTELTGEICCNSDASTTLRTIARLSHDANSEEWTLSWSWSETPHGFSIAQAGIFTSQTGGILYLKATFARLTKNSQDTLNIAWKQSLASA